MSECVVFEGPFAYAGDRLVKKYELGRHTLTLTAEIEVDQFQNIDDEVVPHDPERVAAFKRGEWHFLEVVVSLAINGEEVDASSLSGIDVGDDPRYLLCVANYLVGQLNLPLRALDYDAAMAPLETL